MIDIDSLMDELLEATYTVNGDTFHLLTYDKKYRLPEFKRLITNWCIKQEGKQIGKMAELEAKVKAYEAIISNSNFSMAILKEEESEKSCQNSNIDSNISSIFGNIQSVESDERSE